MHLIFLLSDTGRITTTGEAAEQVSMAQLLGAIQALGDRLTRLEQPQPPQRRGPIRPGNVPQPQEETDEEMPELEDDPPPAPNFHRQHRMPNNRDRDRGREEDYTRPGGQDIKLKSPTFAGKVNPKAYLDWEIRMEYIFEYYHY